MTHTPGPWEARKVIGGTVAIFDVCDPNGRDIVTVYGGGVDLKSVPANARLIAAAPEMLEALKYVLTAHGEQLHDAFGMARYVIKKAEGRA